jgi:peptidoglycan/LPS O-acetylase OafA/YrhL
LQSPAGKMQKPLMYMGKISYGLYVYHVLWLGASRDLMKYFGADPRGSVTSQLYAMSLALPATVITGILSYHYIESPFLRWKKRFTVIVSRPV